MAPMPPCPTRLDIARNANIGAVSGFFPAEQHYQILSQLKSAEIEIAKLQSMLGHSQRALENERIYRTTESMKYKKGLEEFRSTIQNTYAMAAEKNEVEMKNCELLEQLSKEQAGRIGEAERYENQLHAQKMKEIEKVEKYEKDLVSLKCQLDSERVARASDADHFTRDIEELKSRLELSKTELNSEQSSRAADSTHFKKNIEKLTSRLEHCKKKLENEREGRTADRALFRGETEKMSALYIQHRDALKLGNDKIVNENDQLKEKVKSLEDEKALHRCLNDERVPEPKRCAIVNPMENVVKTQNNKELDTVQDIPIQTVAPVEQIKPTQTSERLPLKRRLVDQPGFIPNDEFVQCLAEERDAYEKDAAARLREALRKAGVSEKKIEEVGKRDINWALVSPAKRMKYGIKKIDYQYPPNNI